MTPPDQSFDTARGRAFPEAVTERWPLAARASLVMSLCGLFWGLLGAAVLHLASH